MSDNIWQRFKLLLTRELNNAHEDATEAALRCVIRAAEDAEREGQRPAPLCLCTFATANGSADYAARGVHHDKRCHMYEAAVSTAEPRNCAEACIVSTLPPLDPALVEECARAWATASGSIQDGIAAALTHYRERVGGPLREELWQARETSKKWLDGLESAERNVAHFHAEADRLRGELKAITADRDGWQAACNRSREECGRLRGELAKQVEANRLLAAERDAHSKMRRQWQEVAESGVNPQPTDEERRKAAEYVRDRAARGNAMGVTIAERIATLLESPALARKSIGRRWVVVRNETGRILDTGPSRASIVNMKYEDSTITECDLVPVEEEKP